MNILIVDDEKAARMTIKAQLEGLYTITEASTFNEAIEALGLNKFDICYIDLKLDKSKELTGLKLIPIASKKGIYTVVMTSIEDDKIAESAYNLGCQDVYNKGNEKKHILQTINRYLLSRDNFTEGFLFKDVFKNENQKYKEELKKLLKVIPSNISILIRGKTGTGKTFTAEKIHEISKCKGQYVELNCSNFRGDTLMFELFGHAKGSFTGALGDKAGKLLEANGGTLFLDEIGSMPLEAQEMLRKAIEQKKFHPVGSNKEVHSDFRIICATLEDLETLITIGKFRDDLYQRISGYTFIQPELSEGREDILPLLNKIMVSLKKVIFKPEAKAYLKSYKWPGNIREVSQFAEAISLSDSGVITLEQEMELARESKQVVRKSNVEDYQYEIANRIGLKQFVTDLYGDIIKRSVEENNGNNRRAISELKISSKILYKYVNIDSKDSRPLPFSETGVLDELH